MLSQTGDRKRTMNHSSSVNLVRGGSAAVLCSVLCFGCKQESTPTGGLEPTPARSSQPTAPSPTNTDAAPTEGGAVASFAGLTGPRPEAWIEEPPASSMRATQFKVPGEGEAGDAELAVFANIGGSNDANIARWVGQFTSSDGTGVEPELSSLEANGMPVTVVWLQGTYSGMLPSGAPTEAAANTGFLAAIVETPFTVLHLRLLGPLETVEANRDDFMALISGLKSDSSG